MHNQPCVLKLEVSSALCVSSSLLRQLTDLEYKYKAIDRLWLQPSEYNQMLFYSHILYA